MPASLKQPASPRRHVTAASRHQTKDEMLILATNRFCDLDTHDRLSSEQYREAFNLLIGDASRSTRQLIARNLAHTAFTPRSIALFLAMEPTTISEPILKHSPVLGQLDLLQLLQKKGEEIAAMVATRPDIGPSVVRRLNELQNKPAQQALSENDALVNGANVRSAKALFSKIEVRKASRDEERDAATARAEAERTKKSTPVEKSSPENQAEKALLSAAGRGGRLEEEFFGPTPTAPFDFANSLEKMARVHSHQGMAVLMQKQFGFTLETAHRILADKSGDTLAVLLSAADIGAAQANRIQLLANPAIGLSTQNAMRAVRFYARLNPQTSGEAVAQWPRAEKPGTPHQEYYQESRTHRTGGFARRASTPAAVDTQQQAADGEKFRSTG